MVEFRCIGHDSRHVCRSLCWRREGGFLCGSLYYSFFFRDGRIRSAPEKISGIKAAAIRKFLAVWK